MPFLRGMRDGGERGPTRYLKADIDGLITEDRIPIVWTEKACAQKSIPVATRLEWIHPPNKCSFLRIILAIYHSVAYRDRGRSNMECITCGSILVIDPLLSFLECTIAMFTY
jgi:hypothetical protein